MKVLPACCHPRATDRDDARDGGVHDSKPDPTSTPTLPSLLPDMALAPSPLAKQGRRNTALPCAAAACHRTLPSLSLASPSLTLFEVDGQQQPGTTPLVWHSSAWFRQSQKKPSCRCLLRGRRQTRRQPGKRKGRHSHSAEAARSKMARLRRPCHFSFYLHGEETTTLPSSKPPV